MECSPRPRGSRSTRSLKAAPPSEGSLRRGGRKAIQGHPDGTFRGGRNVLLESRIGFGLVPDSAAYRRYLALEYERGMQPGDAHHWQAVRRALAGMLKDHENLVFRATRDPYLPYDAAQRLRVALERTSNGERDPLLQPFTMPGGRGNLRSLAAQQAIDAAVDYLSACDDKILVDPRSRTTVAKAFGVAVQTVRRWLKSGGSSRERRNARNARLRATLPYARPSDHPRLIRKLMRIRAKTYRDFL